MSNVSLFIACTSVSVGIWLVCLFLKRRLYHEFPYFFGYVVAAAVVGEVTRLLLVSHYKAYFYTYWSLEVLYAALGLLALYEAYRRVFRNFFRVYSWFWTLFPSAVALVIVISIYYAMTRPPKQALPLISVILSLEIGINLIRSSIFLLFLGAMLFFRARRRSYPLGIVTGFAVLAAAGLMYGLRSEFGTKFTFLVQYGVPVAYILAEAVWLDTFLRPPEAPPQLPPGMTLEQALAEMAQGHQELKDWKDFSRKVRK